MGALFLLLGIGIVVVGFIAVQQQRQIQSPSSSTTNHRAGKTTASARASRATETVDHYAYRSQTYLMTRAEAAFYRVLVQAVDDLAVVFTQVRVADVLTPRDTRDRSQWQRAFNKISAKHLDFVLCDRRTLKILAAIELDDRSHQRPDRQERDALLNHAMDSAGLPLVRVPVQAQYAVADLAAQLAPLLSSPPSARRPRRSPQPPDKGNRS